MYMAGPQFLQAITGADQPVRIAPFVLGFFGRGSVSRGLHLGGHPHWY